MLNGLHKALLLDLTRDAKERVYSLQEISAEIWEYLRNIGVIEYRLSDEQGKPINAKITREGIMALEDAGWL